MLQNKYKKGLIGRLVYRQLYDNWVLIGIIGT